MKVTAFDSPKTVSQAHSIPEIHIVRCTCLSPLAYTRLHAYNPYRLKIKSSIRYKSQQPSSFLLQNLRG